MPDTSSIHDQIVARLAEVEQQIEPLRIEAEQLTRLLATFVDAPAPAAVVAPKRGRAKAVGKPAAKAPVAASSTGGAKRGRPVGSGNRAHQAVAKIIAQPGITASELAKSMGISPNYLYRVLPRLEKEAKVTKQGKGYHPVGAGATAATNGHAVAV